MKKFFKKGELKILWPFYANNLINMFFFYYLFAVIYFTEIGLSPVQIGLFYTVAAVSSLIFEIPTGAFADIYGRKPSTILGYILSALVMIPVYFTTNFTLLLVLSALWGFSSTFISGASDAWVVDLLKGKRRKDLIDEYYTKRHSFYAFAGFMSGLVGALLVGIFGIEIIWLSFAGTYLANAIFLSFGEEKFTRKKRTIRNHIKEFFSHNKKSMKYIKKDINLRKILFATIFFAIAVYITMSEILWVPFFTSLGLSQASFGLLLSATWVLGIISPFIAKKIAKRMNSKRNFLLMILTLIIITFFLMIFVNSLFLMLVLYILYFSLFDTWAPVHTPLLQHFIPSKMRATILSFRTFILSSVSAVIPLFVGFLLEFYNPKIILISGAAFFIPIIIIYSTLKDKH